MPRTTIADVAQAAGVSVSTVSRALRGLDRVSPETRERIEQEAKRLHFSFSKSASSLASGKTMRVAVLLPNEISSRFNAHAFEGIYEVMSKAGYDIVPYIVWTQDDLDAFFQNLPGNRNVDAVIEASFDFDEAKKQVLGDLTIPVVGMNAPSTHGLDAGVAIDDEASMATIVRFLKSLGHKTLAYIEQPINTTPFVCSDRLRKKAHKLAVTRMKTSSSCRHYPISMLAASRTSIPASSRSCSALQSSRPPSASPSTPWPLPC